MSNRYRILSVLLVISLLYGITPKPIVYSFPATKPVIQNDKDVPPIEPDTTKPPQMEKAGVAGTSDPTQITAAVNIDQMQLTPEISADLLAKIALDYTSYVYSHSDILLFAYEANTSFEVYHTNGSLVWQGTLNAGQHRSLTPGAGIYLVAGSNPFSINVGDALSGYVWGYYAIDQFGRGVSTLLHTYQANWSGATFDPRFIIFAYTNNTQVQILDSDSKQLIWNGILQAGQHYSNNTIDGKFVTVSSTQPVAALSYTDQGFYVPSSNATFVGKTFYTYVGNSATPNNYWVEDLNLIAYENTGITVKNSDTGAILWSGTLNAGNIQSIPNLNGTFVTVQSSGNIAVSVSPYGSYQGGNYYHSLHLQDSSGTGIGTHFVVPIIPSTSQIACRIVLFSYTDSNDVIIRNQAGATIWADKLNQANFKSLSPTFGTYIIDSRDALSAIFDCGDEAGATFAPVRYAVVQVDVTSPSGGAYYYGSSMLVTAKATVRGDPLLNANVQGQIQLNSSGDYIEFAMFDNATNGDTIANDGIYAALISMPGPDDMLPGNYLILISARSQDGGQIVSGSGSSIFSLLGSASGGALAVAASLDCPQPFTIIVGNTCLLSVEAKQSDGSIYTGGLAQVVVFEPNNHQNTFTLSTNSNHTWQNRYTFQTPGRYLFAIQVTPDPSAALLAGYTSLLADTLRSNSPMNISVLNFPTEVAPNQLVEFGVYLSVDGTAITNANVSAEITPGLREVIFVELGNGIYMGAITTEMRGSYAIHVRAASPLYQSATKTVAFEVSSVPTSLTSAIATTGIQTEAQLNKMINFAWQIAYDGDWFWQRLEPDIARRNWNVVLNTLMLGYEVRKLRLQNLATASTAPMASEFNALKPFSWLRDEVFEPDKRVWNQWATRLENSLQKEIFYDYAIQGKLPPGIGSKVLQRAGVYYLSKLTGETLDETAKKAVVELIAQMRMTDRDFLKNRIYPIFATQTSADASTVTEYAQALHDAPAAISPSLEPLLVDNLNSRLMANHYRVLDMQYQNQNLWHAQDRREEEENTPLWEAAMQDLWKTALPIIASAFFGGTVGVGVGIIIAVYEFRYDNARVTEDDKAQAWAYNYLETPAMHMRDNVFSNAIGGLVQVRQASLNEPSISEVTVPVGNILSIRDVSDGISQWKFFEKQAWSEIVIQNKGQVSAFFNIRTYYDQPEPGVMGSRYYWIDYMRHPQRKDNIGWIWLSPNETAKVEIVFRDKNNNLDMRPVNNNPVFFVLSALTTNGNFFVDSRMHTFAPADAITDASHSTYTSGEAAPLAYPIATQIVHDQESGHDNISMLVENPLPYPISIKVSQTIPEDLTILSSNGGLIEDDRIQWRRVVPAYTTTEVAYTVHNDSSEHSQVIVPAAELSFFVSEVGHSVVFTSTAVSIAALDGTLAGDCDNNRTITASDVTALALEFFDGDDNSNPLGSSGGTYAGSAACDANEDSRIGASDVTCIARLFFNGPGVCRTTVETAATANPSLGIPNQIPAVAGGQVTVPIRLTPNDSTVGSLLFSLDYDETWLHFDPADNDGNGIPDAITFNLPAEFVTGVTFDPSETDGELDFTIGNFAATPVALPAGSLATITLTAGQPATAITAGVGFAQTPAVSFGHLAGTELVGATVAGSVFIAVQPQNPSSNHILYLPLISEQ